MENEQRAQCDKSGDIGRMIVKILRADAFMYNTTLRDEEDVNSTHARAHKHSECFKRSRRASRCNKVPMQTRARGPSPTGTCVRGGHHTLHTHAARHPQTANPRLDPRLQHTSGWRRSRRGCVLHARAASPDRLRASEARPYHHYPRQRRRSDRRRR